MKDYKYKISLKLWHPSMNPAEITAILDIEPTVMFVAGQARKTPTGTPLEGVYRESYWFAKLIQNDNEASDGLKMEDYIFQLTKQLSSHKAFFQKIITEGGMANLDIATDGRSNYAIVLPPELLLALSNSGLTLVVDIFPYPQNW